MTEHLVKLLTETDDPAVIRKVLDVATDQETHYSSSDSQRSLSELYNQFLSRRRDRSPNTIPQYKRTIPRFVDFAKRNGVTTPSEISTKLLDQYVDVLQDAHDADATILTHTKNIRGWLRWLNKRGHCPETVYRILDKDELGLEPNVRDEALPADAATEILGKLRQQRRGSRMHTLLELLWNGGFRIGGLHSLDVQDFFPERNVIELRNRPEQGTRLKNGSQDHGRGGDGERDVLIADPVSVALSLYIQYERPDITDDHGRDPLFTTQYGRAARSTLRRAIYEATSCRWHTLKDEEIECDGDCDPDSDVCPCSYYPHAIRRGAIVNQLSGGLNCDKASERFDVSIPILKKHYDPRSKRRRLEDRAQSVREAW